MHYMQPIEAFYVVKTKIFLKFLEKSAKLSKFRKLCNDLKWSEPTIYIKMFLFLF